MLLAVAGLGEKNTRSSKQRAGVEERILTIDLMKTHHLAEQSCRAAANRHSLPHGVLGCDCDTPLDAMRTAYDHDETQNEGGRKLLRYLHTSGI